MHILGEDGGQAYIVAPGDAEYGSVHWPKRRRHANAYLGWWYVLLVLLGEMTILTHSQFKTKHLKT